MEKMFFEFRFLACVVVNGDIEVVPSAVLTINQGIVQLPKDRHINVQTTGKVAHQGGTLSALCNAWGGVVVNSNAGLAQGVTTHGLYYGYPQTIIEHANTGLKSVDGDLLDFEQQATGHAATWAQSILAAHGHWVMPQYQLPARAGGRSSERNQEQSRISSTFLSPNPVDDILTIHLGDSNPGITLRVINQLGITIFVQRTTIGQTEAFVSVSLLPKGIYVLRAGDIAQKFVVEH